jgi:hypothetical protein
LYEILSAFIYIPNVQRIYEMKHSELWQSWIILNIIELAYQLFYKPVYISLSQHNKKEKVQIAQKTEVVIKTGVQI